MSRWLAALALVVAVGLLALGGRVIADRGSSRPSAAWLPSESPTSDAVASSGLPIIGCAARAEPSPKRFERRRDVVRGDFALITIARGLPQLAGNSYRPQGGRLAGIKLPVGVRAGHAATLRVGVSDRRHAALIFRHATRDARQVADGDQVVTFNPCRASTPGFSDGVVGPITGWPGALIVTGPRCIRLQLRVDGRRLADIRLPLGRRCARAAGSRQPAVPG